jgi:hypothetical protein
MPGTRARVAYSDGASCRVSPRPARKRPPVTRASPLAVPASASTICPSNSGQERTLSRCRSGFDHAKVPASSIWEADGKPGAWFRRPFRARVARPIPESRKSRARRRTPARMAGEGHAMAAPIPSKPRPKTGAAWGVGGGNARPAIATCLPNFAVFFPKIDQTNRAPKFLGGPVSKNRSLADD